MTDYTSARAKLGRAEEHLEALEAELRAWMDTKPLDAIPSARVGDTEDWHIEIFTPLRGRLNLIAGDCVHNFKCALDHLTMALAVANGASPDSKDVAFPICRDATDFAKRTSIKALAQDARDFIESVQPYRLPGAWALRELNYLDNKDKHRFILQSRLEGMVTFAAYNPGVSIRYAPSLQLEGGAHYATVTYPPGYAGRQEKPNLSAGICVERSNGIGFLEVQRYLRQELLPLVRDRVLEEAARQLP
jgi:hypothetical protein